LILSSLALLTQFPLGALVLAAVMAPGTSVCAAVIVAVCCLMYLRMQLRALPAAGCANRTLAPSVGRQDADSAHDHRHSPYV